MGFPTFGLLLYLLELRTKPHESSRRVVQQCVKPVSRALDSDLGFRARRFRV